MIELSSLLEVSLGHYIFLGLFLFAVGLLTIMLRKNMIVMLMGVELLLNGVNTIFLAFSHFSSHTEGQILVFFILTVAAAEAGVGLALAVSIYKEFKEVNISFFESLKG